MRLLLLCALALPFGGAAFGQQQLSEQDFNRAQARDREQIHPADPLDLVGSEQGDNSFRDRTPSLLNSDKVALLVDQDELYERRLAMVEGRASFASGPRVDARVSALDPSRTLTAHGVVEPAAESIEEVPEEDSGTTRLIGIAAILALVGAARKLS